MNKKIIYEIDAINLLKKWADGYRYIEIETELAIKEFEDLPPTQPEPNCVLTMWGDCSYAETGCSDCLIKNKITTALSAQPEQPKGEWINDGDCYICSECQSVYGWWADSQVSNFCPNCGADMRDEQNE